MVCNKMNKSYIRKERKRKQSKDHTCCKQLSDRPDLFRQFVSIPSFLHSLLHTANWSFPSSSKKTIKDGMQFPFPFYKYKCPCKYVPKSVESSLHIPGSIFPILHLFKAQNVWISVSSHKGGLHQRHKEKCFENCNVLQKYVCNGKEAYMVGYLIIHKKLTHCLQKCIKVRKKPKSWKSLNHKL